jgi:hypothetical protein
MTADPLIAAARFLAAQLEWMRHAVDEQGQPCAVAAFSEIAHCAGRMRGLVDGARDRRYLGPCGAPMDDHDCDAPRIDGRCETCTCDGNVHAPVGSATGRCDTCKTEYDVDARREWIRVVVRDWPFTATWISRELNLSIHVKTIRTWANRGQLPTYWRTEGGLVTPWVDTDDADEVKARGDRLHYVGDVERLHAARETDRATRERRTAAKAAESENAA